MPLLFPLFSYRNFVFPAPCSQELSCLIRSMSPLFCLEVRGHSTTMPHQLKHPSSGLAMCGATNRIEEAHRLLRLRPIRARCHDLSELDATTYKSSTPRPIRAQCQFSYVYGTSPLRSAATSHNMSTRGIGKELPTRCFVDVGCASVM
jgi:hypothetical protein